MSRSTRAWATAACIPLIAASALGCSGDSDPSPVRSRTEVTSAPVPSDPINTLNKAQLESARLDIGDMPTGFSQDTSDSDDDQPGNAECSRLRDLSPPAEKTESVEFKKSEAGPFVASEVAAYNGRGAEVEMAEIRNFPSKCREFTARTDGKEVKYSVGSLSMPPYGDESAALRIIGSTEGVNVGVDFLFIRLGNAITLVESGDLGTPETALTEQMAIRASSKLQQLLAGETPAASAPASS
ncbi:hypothetical protein [Streptomyces sp. NPDC055085]